MSRAPGTRSPSRPQGAWRRKAFVTNSADRICPARSSGARGDPEQLGRARTVLQRPLRDRRRRVLTPRQRDAVVQLLSVGTSATRAQPRGVAETDPLEAAACVRPGTNGPRRPDPCGHPARKTTLLGTSPSFVRNIGEPRDKHLGAGTFGFGKTVFYLVSRAQTLVAYTRCRNNGAYESRLIGCAVGDSFNVADNRGHGLTPGVTGGVSARRRTGAAARRRCRLRSREFGLDAVRSTMMNRNDRSS